MGLDDRDLAAGAAAAAVKYLEETQFSNADNISSLTPMLPKENLVLDQSTQANLELADKGQATLFWVLNRCRTPMGRRALKEWITSPLQDLDEISRRQDMIETLAGDGRLRAGLAELLSRCRDMGKIPLPPHAQDGAALRCAVRRRDAGRRAGDSLARLRLSGARAHRPAVRHVGARGAAARCGRGQRPALSCATAE